MINPSQFESIAQKLFAVLPQSVKQIETDIQAKFKEVLQTAFSNLNLVTREEFDVQIKVLAKTREKVDALEKQLNAQINK